MFRATKLLNASKLFIPSYNFCRLPTNRLFHSSRPSLLDPYASLGVSKDASEKEIKKKYYALAKQFHPDINKDPGADKKFQDIQNSYEILSDKDKRRQYDQFGASAFDGSGGNPANGGQGYPNGGGFQGFGFDPFGGSGFGNFEDIFSAFSGQQQSNSRSRGRPMQQVYKGHDIEILVQLTLEEAALGAEKKVRYSVMDECGTCKGTGLKEGCKPQTCGHCHGTGTAMHVIQGGFQMASTCPSCHGTGEVVPASSQCSSCHGHGTKTDINTLDVHFPAGVNDGMRLRERNLGDSPEVRKSSMTITEKGDLIIKIRVKPHPLFKRNGKDLVYEAHIPITTAILGGKIQVPTLRGPKLSVGVPSGCKYHDIITIPGQGMPVNSRTNGDMKICIVIDSFRPSDETQTVLLEALADSINDKNARRKYKPLHEVEEEEELEDSGKEKEKAEAKEGLFRKLIRKVLSKDNK